MEDLSKLQKLINEKAKKRLAEDIRHFIEQIHETRLTEGVKDVFVSLPDNKTVNLKTYLEWDLSPHLMRSLIKQYEEEETKMFFEKVHELDYKVKQLLNGEYGEYQD